MPKILADDALILSTKIFNDKHNPENQNNMCRKHLDDCIERGISYGVDRYPIDFYTKDVCLEYITAGYYFESEGEGRFQQMFISWRKV